MVKAVFTTRVDPEYDDIREEKYHFPRTYLNQVRGSVGDWIVYYEPRRGKGRQAYFATARVVDVQSDPGRQDHYYAFVEDYLEFLHPVSYLEGAHFFESALAGPEGRVNLGAFQRSVRALPDAEYELIFRAGFAQQLTTGRSAEVSGFAEDFVTFDRPVIESLVSRPFREAAFASRIRSVYDSTCAMTGLKLINGGGRPEIEAAHIRPVAGGHRGPDSVRNGMALSRTIHWMFDRGLMSLQDDGRILIAKTARQEGYERIQSLLNRDGYARFPKDPRALPHPAFLRYHREQIFKD